MTTQDPGNQNSGGQDDLREEARERMEEMPAETALGNRDPQGGGEGDPKTYEEEHGSQQETGSSE